MSSSAIATRKSVSFSQRDLDDIAKLRGTPLGREVLAELGVDVDASEAQFLHDLLLVAVRTASEHAMEASYAADAAERRAGQDRRRAVSRRQRPSWSDEPSE